MQEVRLQIGIPQKSATFAFRIFSEIAHKFGEITERIYLAEYATPHQYGMIPETLKDGPKLM
ncbi:hypothetical protein [Methanogenium organophilum]|uniref:Uncharacterized protein n=1 Tax=Methanogenium organophilum TaxID=2199 RepID=A0A9X9S5H8_METOG|nr:hypothetical protein [Methanogenium organophilum]WAI02118.1 hypothetical protein OU421_04405 [Methanogenium organophilum]